MTNEPTTGEIVRALREDCSLLDDNTDKFAAADRLESQERELSGITGELERFRTFHERYAEQTSKKYIDDICALTARAESAEAERDAAKRDIEEIMAMHGLEVFTMCAFCAMPDDDTCFIVGDSKKCKAKWRGLQPQEGDLKENGCNEVEF